VGFGKVAAPSASIELRTVWNSGITYLIPKGFVVLSFSRVRAGALKRAVMSDRKPLMPKATAVWLVENTSLAFDQIAEFCGLHPLEVKGIADDDPQVVKGIKGYDHARRN
jgi:hypothetical protein